tara:strand:+ start:2089 stop:2253 length:165 start_codon:yes stop_codon:yes gene_type:complete
MPTITQIRQRPATRNQNYYIVTYSHGIVTPIHRDDDAVVKWLAQEGNVLSPAEE